MDSVKEFCLNVRGDFSQLYNAIRDYDFGSTDSKTQEYYRNLILNSRMYDFDDDPDSTCSLSFRFDSFIQLSNLIQRWEPIADSLELWASGKTNEAIFEIGFCKDKNIEVVMPCCKSRISNVQGKVAEVAIRAAHEILELTKRSSNEA